MKDYPTLRTDSPPTTLLATWENTLDIADPNERSPEGRKCCPPGFVLFLNDMMNVDFRIDGDSGTILNKHGWEYRIDIQHKGVAWSTLAIQTNGQGSKTVCNLYIALEDVNEGWITTNVVRQAFRHMFKTRKWKNGGHMAVFRDERKGLETFNSVVFVFGRPSGGA